MMKNIQCLRSPGTAAVLLGALSICLGFASFLILASCPNPISEELARQVTDSTGPVITITEPVDWSIYSTVVRVSGRVWDVDESGNQVTGNRISSCYYRVPGTLIQGSFEIDNEGNFSFTFSTRDQNGYPLLESTASLEVSAEDWNGNKTSVRRTLVRGAVGDVPGFTVIPGNKSVMISWGEVPGALRYDLVEYRYGLLKTDIESPYILEGLENGELYQFQMRAIIPQEIGVDAYSSLVEKMPLSSNTFVPWVKETGYRSITIEWRDNLNVSLYTVERSLSSPGPWEVIGIQSSQNGTLFTDTRVDHDTEYFYRIRPGAFAEQPSEWCSASPGRFGHYPVYRFLNGSSRFSTIVSDLDGIHAYVAVENGGLAIVDIQDPYNLGQPVYITGIGTARSVAVNGEYAYVASWGTSVTKGLHVIDITNPHNPSVISSQHKDNRDGYSVAVYGDYVYMGSSSIDNGTITNGVDIFNISENPASPEWIAFRQLTGIPYQVTAKGERLYAGTGAGIEIINISNPQDTEPPDPVVFNGPDGPGVTWDITTAGNYMYAATYTKGLGVFLIDDNDPDLLALEGYHDLTGGGKDARSIALHNDRIYLAGFSAGAEGLHIFCIADDPSQPEYLEYRPTPQGGRGVAAAHHAAVVSLGTGGIAVFDLAPGPLAGGEPAVYFTGLSQTVAQKIVVEGGHAFVVGHPTGFTGLFVCSIDPPDNPQFSGGWLSISPAWAKGVKSAGNYLYIAGSAADTEHGLYIVDVSVPSAPVLTGYMATASQANGVAVAGSWAFIPTFSNGLAIIDISDPELPGEPVYCDIGVGAYGAAVSGSYAYIAAWNRIAVVDISDPAAPVSKGDVSSPPSGQIKSVHTSGKYLYAASRIDDSVRELAIYDISQNPDNPAFRTKITTDSHPGSAANDEVDVVISGSYAFLAAGNRVAVIDISNPEIDEIPARQREPFYVDLDRPVRGVAVSGRHVYAAAGTGVSLFSLLEDE